MPLEVVCAVIIRDGKVLCMKRKQRGSNSTAGMFEFPGGKIDPGETPFDAIAREIWEEMEWRVEPRAILASVTHSYPDFDIHLTAILCDAPHDGFALHDHDAYRWLLPADLTTVEWAAADRRLINAINWEQLFP